LLTHRRAASSDLDRGWAVTGAFAQGPVVLAAGSGRL